MSAKLGYGPVLPIRLAMDAAPASLAPRKPTSPASAPARKPLASTTPSASPRPAAPKKPAADSPSRQDNLQTLLDFLSANLSANLFAQVEAELMERFAEEPETSPQAADRRPRFAADASGERGFLARFPSARKIGFA